MKRPVTSARFPSISAGPPQGYTLVEILVATALTLIMVAAVVQIFGSIGESVGDTRATLEMSDGLRSTRTRLEMDLAGVTVTMLPPRRPETAEGYFQYTEGPVGPILASAELAKNNDDPSNVVPDTTVGDFDDVLMFTTRSSGRPFVGRYWDPVAGVQSTIESDVAQIAWFMRGRTLYRRVLLVTAGAQLNKPANKSFFAVNDISVRRQGNVLVANTLGDLTKHECRYAHHPVTDGFPCHPHFRATWPGDPPTINSTEWATVALGPKLGLGLPTLRECCALSPGAGSSWPTGTLPAVSLTQPAVVDFWGNPHPWPEVDRVTGTLNAYLDPSNTRIAEDVVLTNVIGFNVKAWDARAPVVSDGTTALGPSDPGYKALVSNGAPVVSYGAYVDLNYDYGGSGNLTAFAGPGEPKSGMVRVYDTWSFHYEHDGIDQDGKLGADQGTNGFDDDGNGIVDDPGEMETSPPYPVPLRAIQVKIRVYEPDSRQIREVTVVQEFLPK